jgi:two-component system, sensor histidine kinase and response regulator
MSFSKKILIVDDSKTNLAVISNLLSAKDYVISFATDGEMALKIVKKDPPELILMDVMMPGLNGFETCQKLKKNPATKKIPVIFVSANNDTENIVKGFEAGGVDYVGKPLVEREILARVELHLEGAELRSSLEEKVQVRTKELESANNQLTQSKEIVEAALRVKNDFFARVSHEFRTPLNAIIGFSELLQMNFENTLTENQVRDIDNINDAGKTLLKMFENILKLTELESGDIDLDIEPVEILPLWNHVKTSYSNYAHEKNIEVITKISEEANPCIMADQSNLQWVFEALLHNAIIYNNPNGKIWFSSDPVTNGHIRLNIRDNGTGISSEKQDLIFKSLNTFGPDYASEEGLGVSLTAAHKLIGKMSGQIGFTTEVDKGTTFFLELPLAPKE